jgi:hypothetical protein
MLSTIRSSEYNRIFLDPDDLHMYAPATMTMLFRDTGTRSLRDLQSYHQDKRPLRPSMWLRNLQCVI